MADEIRNNPHKHRFEATINGHVAVLDYEQSGNRITLIQTVVPAALGSRGLGSTLARTALDYARQHQLAVVPKCEFVAGFIVKHPEYQSLVAPGPL